VKKTPLGGHLFGTLLALLAVALVPSSLSAATDPVLYVDRANSGCSDTGSGTAAQPFCTISAAAARVAAGQTVQVASGTYSEQVTVPVSGTSTAPITFTVAPGAAVTVTGKVNGFVVSSKSWIAISGFNVTNTSGNGIYISGSSHISVTGNHVTYSGQPLSGLTKSGIALSGSSDSLVSSNTADHNTYAGIELKNSSTRDEVRDNITFSNARQYERAAPGIRLVGSPGNVVHGNITHNNEDSGIESYSGANDTLIYDNVSYNNGDHGIDNYVTTGQRIFANTVYKNVTAGINVEGGSTGATLANNISVDNGIKSPRTHSDIRIESGSTSGTTLDHDVVYLSTPDTILIWNSVSYSSLAAFQAASGQEAHAVQASPLWTSPAGGDFHLTAGSPAIDSANSGANGQPSLDVEGNPRVDDPATPNTGIGPRSYDDRGAYEFSPSGSPPPPPPDAPPAAALTVTPSSGTAPLSVTADASASTDGDTTPIASYSFDFGDGSAPVGPQAAATAGHSYATAGTYTVRVTVTDTGGLTATATAAVQVTTAGEDAAPTAALALTPATGTVNLAVTADASGSSDTDATPIAGYSFDFGDGTPVVGPQSGATSAHTYTVPGTYTVTVTVTDTAGLSGAATAQVTVMDNPPAARLSTRVSGLDVTADASASTDSDATGIASYTFDFGDGSAPVGPQGSPTATHTYASAGSYVVRVTVTDTGGRSSTATSTVEAAIVQDAAPAAALTVTPTSGVINLAVTADASASTDADLTPIAGYSFDFGDGTAPTGLQSSAKAAHTYTAAGTYTVKVTAQDTAGLSSTATSQVTVTDNPPAARLTVQISRLSVAANASGSTDGDATPITSYTFDFGDGSPPVGPQASPTASHTYAAASSYTVTVTVTDTAGLASSVKRKIKLR
jgi:parallel beta-helix repeat protein